LGKQAKTYTEQTTKLSHDIQDLFADRERVFDMLDADVLGAKDHSDNIKAEGVAGHLVAGDPNLCGTDELPLLSPAYACQRAAEFQRFAGLHLYECHQPLPPICNSASRDQVYVAVTVAEALLRYLPTVSM
jgi:hypothetical protein